MDEIHNGLVAGIPAHHRYHRSKLNNQSRNGLLSVKVPIQPNLRLTSERCLLRTLDPITLRVVDKITMDPVANPIGPSIWICHG